MAVTESELLAVDEFLKSKKRLSGQIPTWNQSPRPRELQAVWSVIDDIGVVRGTMKFRISQDSPDFPSVSLIYQGNSISRLDIVPPAVCEQNPLTAYALGLPSQVCGSHCHMWPDNRAHIQSTGLWEMPCRRPVESGLRRVPQMLPWFSDLLGIELTPEQRHFDTPPRTQLFGENG